MKKVPTIAIGTPHNRDLTPEYVTSLINLLRYSTGKVNLELRFHEGCLIHMGRNVIGSRGGVDYVMFIDSDVMFPAWGMERLIERDKDVIGGLYYRKIQPFSPLVHEYSKKHKAYRDIWNPPSQPFECDAIATGFLLIKTKVLKKLYSKKFMAKNGAPFNFIQKKDGTDYGEDISFCRRAKKAGFEVWCDPTIPLEHIGERPITRRENEDWKVTQKLYNETYNNDIEGWMSPEELRWLNSAAKHMDSIIEIGSWKGRSTHALLSGCKGTVTAVDTWKGTIQVHERKGTDMKLDPGHEEAMNKDIFKIFEKNVGEFKNLKVIKSDSLKAKVTKADMVFIDGDHSYKGVKADIKKYLPKARKLICGHDFQWSGVQQAVTEKFGMVDTVGTIWYKKL